MYLQQRSSPHCPTNSARPAWNAAKYSSKPSEAIEDSKRAVNALVKHLAALDVEIEAYVKIVENSEHAASYLGSQVKNITEHITNLTNVPESQMQTMMKILADTEEKIKEHEKEAKANKEDLKEARTKRQKAGKESEQAQAKLKEQTKEGKATRLILPAQEQKQQEESSTGGGPSTLMTPAQLLSSAADEDTEMKEVRNKRVREDNKEEQGPAKRAVTPVQDEVENVRQTLKDAAKEPNTEEQATGEKEDATMEEDL